MGIMAKCANGHVLRVKDEFAGRSGICPHCRGRVFVPMPIRDKSSISDEEILGLLGQPGKPSRVPAATATVSDSVLDIRSQDIPAADTIGSPGSSVARKVKICPKCEHITSAAFSHCPRCGTSLPVNEKVMR